ncbi:MAG: CDF family Co(II)/Ni(II) efflux transporter DmeF [Zoogloeaceae bacterium]|jgi:cation diffusion facilitator family transporter|nr:CDF family Co(II)/Ni(II) efflux transporter DmeF [Zoogloeaceae bacterium]
MTSPVSSVLLTEPWRHSHSFLDARDAGRQRRMEIVVVLTFVTMMLEVAFGWLTGSMALLADGWHMGSHVAALGLAAFAYRYARQQDNNARFTFGTGKVSALGGFASALLLAPVALAMIWESVARLRFPVAVAYEEALFVAGIGLAVNLASVWLLRDDHDHEHDHDHDHAEDHNLRGAFLHVLADTLTSVFAIVALVAGRYLGWTMLDPMMGIVGALVILFWAKGLLRATSQVLLDAEAHDALRREILKRIEARPGHRVVDLHVWRLSANACGGIVSLVAPNPEPIETYHRDLSALHGLAHITVEIHPGPETAQ